MPLSPTRGPSYGGNQVLITGDNLTNILYVKFGNKYATLVDVIPPDPLPDPPDPPSVTVIAPSGSGTVNVIVKTTAGTSNNGGYCYLEPPVITSISPNYSQCGPANILITITGYNFYTGDTVYFGSVGANAYVINDSLITCYGPTNVPPGTVKVTVTTEGGISQPVEFELIEGPIVTDIKSDRPIIDGTIHGGNNVLLIGSGFFKSNKSYIRKFGCKI